MSFTFIWIRLSIVKNKNKKNSFYFGYSWVSSVVLYLPCWGPTQLIEINELLQLHLSKANQTNSISCVVLNMAGRGLQMRPMNITTASAVRSVDVTCTRSEPTNQRPSSSALRHNENCSLFNCVTSSLTTNLFPWSHYNLQDTNICVARGGK